MKLLIGLKIPLHVFPLFLRMLTLPSFIAGCRLIFLVLLLPLLPSCFFFPSLVFFAASYFSWGDIMAPYWSFLQSLFSQIFNFALPWGITFGAVIVGIFGVPLLVRAIRKFF